MKQNIRIIKRKYKKLNKYENILNRYLTKFENILLAKYGNILNICEDTDWFFRIEFYYFYDHNIIPKSILQN